MTNRKARRAAAPVSIDEVYAFANWIKAQGWPPQDPPAIPLGWYSPLDEQYRAIAKHAGQGAWAALDPRRASREQALAELALSLATGLPWEKDDVQPDGTCAVGGHRVRRGVAEGHGLRIWPWDPDDTAFCLVLGQDRRFAFAGWMFGAEAKRAEWKCASGPGGIMPMYFVPTDSLRPPRTLPGARFE